MALEKRQKILMWGKSHGLRLPIEQIKFLGIKAGDFVTLSVSRGKLIVEPTVAKRSIGELMAEYDDEKQHRMIKY